MANSASIELAMILDEPIDAVELSALLIRRQRQDQVAVERHAFALEPNHVGDEMRGHRLVVGGATPVEVAVLLEEGERIDRPVFALGLDDIEVGEQEDGPPLAAALEPRDQIAFAWVRPENPHVAVGKAGRLQASRHGLRCLGDIAGGRVRGVDLDQFFVDLTGQRVVRRGLRLRACAGTRKNDEQREGDGMEAHDE